MHNGCRTRLPSSGVTQGAGPGRLPEAGETALGRTRDTLAGPADVITTTFRPSQAPSSWSLFWGLLCTTGADSSPSAHGVCLDEDVPQTMSPETALLAPATEQHTPDWTRGGRSSPWALHPPGPGWRGSPAHCSSAPPSLPLASRRTQAHTRPRPGAPTHVPAPGAPSPGAPCSQSAGGSALTLRLAKIRLETHCHTRTLAPQPRLKLGLRLFVERSTEVLCPQ